MVLFAFSLLASYSFLVIGFYVLHLNRKEKLNILAAIEYCCFSWWSLFYAFIYIAPTAEMAMFWHRLASVGWGLFYPVATHFFFILSDSYSDRLRIKRTYNFYCLIYILPIAITINAFLNPAGTSVTSGFIQLQGIGWAYITNVKSPWYWLYLLSIFCYFAVCLKKQYALAITSGRKRFVKQAKSILVLNIFVLLLGIFWELILPVFYLKVPPACHFVAFIWAIGFLYIIKALKLTSLEDATTPDIILKTVEDPILVLDNEGIIKKCNKATENMLKVKTNQIVGKSLWSFFISGSGDAEKINELLSGKQFHNVEIDLIDSTGEKINTTGSFSLAETILDGPIGIVASFHNITNLKNFEKELNLRNEKNLELSKQLEILANYDALTGLPNRRLLFEKIDSAVEEYKTNGKAFALYFIDLDGFKKNNDTYGHDIGDKLLQRCAGIFKATVRKTDFIARLGGDEFVILFEQFDEPYLEGLVERLKCAFLAPIIIDGCICTVRLSLGISKCPENGTSGADLIKCADGRMYMEKSKTK